MDVSPDELESAYGERSSQKASTPHRNHSHGKFDVADAASRETPSASPNPTGGEVAKV